MSKGIKVWLAAALVSGMALAAAAATCERADEKGEVCGAQVWRCNHCMAVGCEDPRCADTLQNPEAKTRECRVCGSADWVEVD